MIYTIIFQDGSSFVGETKWYSDDNCYIVKSSKFPEFKALIGKKITIPKGTAKYFVHEK